MNNWTLDIYSCTKAQLKLLKIHLNLCQECLNDLKQQINISSRAEMTLYTVFILIYAQGMLQFIAAKMTVLSPNMGQK